MQFCVYVRIVSEASGRWESFEYEIYIYIYEISSIELYIVLNVIRGGEGERKENVACFIYI